ncbi:hypothetical protein PIB30_110805, partial [Stylosanthes scabra]|nr:hypothetical protein [Stylosanthes scabra]
AWTSTPMRGSSFWPCKLSCSFSTPILEVPGACLMILASHAYAWASTPMRGSCGATHERLQHGSCVAACCQDSFHAYAWVFYAYA